MPSPLFCPFRALGYVTDNVPFTVQRRGKETFATVSVGRSWQVYNCAKLTLSLVGPQLHGDICALASKGDLTFAAVGTSIVECRRVHQTGLYQRHTAPIIQLQVLGDRLLSLGKDGRLLVWKIGTHGEPEVEIQFPGGFTPTCMTHPDTYVNKVIVGGEDGRLQLWNFMSCKLVYEFKGWQSAVRCLASAPALDVVGIGLGDGRAILHNLKYDETVVSFANASGVGLSADHLLSRSSEHNKVPSGGGATTSIAFRTGSGKPLMAAGGGAGVITVWDLQEKKLHTVMAEAHDGPLLSLHFFAGEPLLMSSARDNSIKQWVFDSSDSMPRLLRFRSGHSAPPTCVRHYGQGLHILSAGQDRALRLFSTIQDQQSRELSQKHTTRRAKRQKLSEQDVKLSRLVAVDACQVRERDWCNVISAHEGDANAYTWRLKHFTLGEHILRPPAYEKAAQGQADVPDAAVTAVGISPCGNFGIVGTAAGRVDRYNLQSGKHRGSYMHKRSASTDKSGLLDGAAGLGGNRDDGSHEGGAAVSDGQGDGVGLNGTVKISAAEVPPWKKQRKAHTGGEKLENAHSSPVVGLAMDGGNKRLVSVGSDGKLCVWDFKSFKLVSELDVGAGALKAAMHPTSMLCAVATEDHEVHMFDVEASRRVRRFRGHRDRITDMRVSEDGKWLITSSMDSTVRVWDIPMARCLQVMRMGAPVTSLSFSPLQDMLATVHINKRGIYLWSNQLLFGNILDIIHSDKPVDVNLPVISAGALGDGSKSAGEGEEEDVNGAVGSTLRAPQHGDGNEADSMYGDSDVEEPSSSVEAGTDDASAPGMHSRRVYELTHLSGGPEPLTPDLVTLSLLPRSQWEGLVHLDAIKARNRPIEPPKKPEAAPFFLPTVPNLEGNVQFDTAAGKENTAVTNSKVVKSKGVGKKSKFLHLLHAGADAGDFTSFMSYLRELSPSQIDLELKSGQLLEGCTEEEVRDVDLLLQCLDHQLCTNTNFEFCQALLQRILQIHGEALVQHLVLRDTAQRIQQRLKRTWGRLDGLLQNARCMVAFFGNLQQ